MVAELNGVSPIELDEKRHDVIDPDGLETIFASEAEQFEALEEDSS